MLATAGKDIHVSRPAPSARINQPGLKKLRPHVKLGQLVEVSYIRNLAFK